MKKIEKCSQMQMKTCSLCNKSSDSDGNSLLYFGEWMSKKEVTVHYYCLLLSTNLPQRGEDNSGILGFFLRDIRLEISKAKTRICIYCFDTSATIQCVTCKKYFHLTCGHTSQCLYQFVGEFKSYCHACIPPDDFRVELFSRKPPRATELCYICAQAMGTHVNRWIYTKCCGNGYTHFKCMKIYALSAGYYLTCIWCKDKRFREDVKYQGIFVPDRDANWEREKGAYGELYRSHNRCDMEICKCSKGRYYTNSSKWQLIICKLCGAFGAHNPACVPGFEGSKEKLPEFKCDICSVTELTVFEKRIASLELIDTSLYVSKDNMCETALTKTLSQSLNNNLKTGSASHQGTANGKLNITDTNSNNFKPQTESESVCIAPAIYTLTQNTLISQQIAAQESGFEMPQKDTSDSEDSTCADLIVQKILGAFELNI